MTLKRHLSALIPTSGDLKPATWHTSQVLAGQTFLIPCSPLYESLPPSQPCRSYCRDVAPRHDRCFHVI